MLNVCFAGVTGWTARSIVPAIVAAPDLALTAGVARSAAGRSLAEATGLDVAGSVFAGVGPALAAAPVDVVIDFTKAGVVRENVSAAIEAGKHVVIGTSGLTAADYAEIDAQARERGVGVLAAGNFSVGAAVLRRAASLAAAHIAHWEVIDYASLQKGDVPSGTARELAETLGQVRAPGGAVPLAELHGPVEARGADVAGSRIHSVRLPSFVVSTEVVFGGTGERVVMRHEAGESANPYVSGTLLAIRRVGEAVGVRRGVDSLLFG